MKNIFKFIALLLIIILIQPEISFGYEGVWSGRVKVTGLGLRSKVSLYLEKISPGAAYKGIMIYNPGKKSESITSVYGYNTRDGLKIIELSDLSNPNDTGLIAMDLQIAKDPKTGADLLEAKRIYQVKSTLVYDTGSVELTKSETPLPESYQSYVNNSPPVWIKNPLVTNAAFEEESLAQNSFSNFQFGIGVEPDVNRTTMEPLVQVMMDKERFPENGSGYAAYLKLPAPERNEGPKILLKSTYLEGNGPTPVKIRLSLVNEYYKDTFLLAESTLALEVEPLLLKPMEDSPSANSNATMRAVGHEYGLDYMEPATGRSELVKMAQQGDLKARAWLGYFYYYGKGGFPATKGRGKDLMLSSKEKLLKEAQEGDMEAMFLSYQILSASFSEKAEKEIAVNYLQRSSYLGYLPAQYESGLLALTEGNAQVALKLANQSFNQGFTKSALIMGYMYMEGKGVRRDVNQSLAWYQKAAEKGDANALSILAQLYSSGTELPPDPEKAIALAKMAAERGSSSAMIFIGDVYLNGNQGLTKDPEEAMKWYTMAAEAGNPQGMLGLGLIFEKGSELGLVTDQKSAFYWINKAAIEGNPMAMRILSQYYAEGDVVEQNAIKSRFWRAEVAVIRPQEASTSSGGTDDFANFWKYADFSPTYYYLPEEDRIIDTGPDLIGGILTGFLGSYAESRSRVQPQINRIELIYEKEGEKVYGGTISSMLKGGIRVQAGQEVEAYARGRIKLGFMLSNISANGTRGYENYSIDPRLPHGAFIMRMSGKGWSRWGTYSSRRFEQGGTLDLAINDQDYTNNAGYFDLKVVVRD